MEQLKNYRVENDENKWKIMKKEKKVFLMKK